MRGRGRTRGAICGRTAIAWQAAIESAIGKAAVPVAGAAIAQGAGIGDPVAGPPGNKGESWRGPGGDRRRNLTLGDRPQQA